MHDQPGAVTSTPIVSPVAVTGTWADIPCLPLPATTPTTIQDAKADGAVSGTLLMAPLAPATGPITVGVAEPVRAGGGRAAQEPMVVVVVKSFWDSPTIKGLRNAVATAVSLAVGIIVVQIMAVNGDITQINWHTTQKAAIGAAAFSLASAYAAWLKRNDNNPVSK